MDVLTALDAVTGRVGGFHARLTGKESDPMTRRSLIALPVGLSLLLTVPAGAEEKKKEKLKSAGKSQ